MTDIVLLAIIIVQAIIIGLLAFFYHRTVKDLADKIALPLYREDTKKTVFVRPNDPNEGVIDSPNLPDHEDLLDLSDVPEEDLYKAAIGQRDER